MSWQGRVKKRLAASDERSFKPKIGRLQRQGWRFLDELVTKSEQMIQPTVRHPLGAYAARELEYARIYRQGAG